MSDDRLRARLVAIFVAGWLAFAYPVLAVFNVRGTVFGVPVFFLYLFCAWAAIIAVTAFVVRRRW